MWEVVRAGVVISQAVILIIFLSGVFSLLVLGEGRGGESLLPQIPLVYDASLRLTDVIWRPFYEYVVGSHSFSPDPEDFERFKRVHAFFMQFALPVMALNSALYTLRRIRELGSKLS